MHAVGMFFVLLIAVTLAVLFLFWFCWGGHLHGERGRRGQEGCPGPRGEPGCRGREGPQGQRGGFGLRGLQGPIGPQGNQGTQGNQGAQGTQGAVGPQSDLQGAQGVIGTQGFQGSGAQGPQGQGGQGPQGPQGPQGTGPQGPQGQGGQGPQGPQGTGPQGPQGIGGQGPQGETGGLGLQGIQGAGAQGPQGQQGIQGSGAQGPTGPAVSLELLVYEQALATQALTQNVENIIDFDVALVNSSSSVTYMNNGSFFVNEDGSYLCTFMARLAPGQTSGLFTSIGLDTSAARYGTNSAAGIAAAPLTATPGSSSVATIRANASTNIQFYVVPPISGLSSSITPGYRCNCSIMRVG